MTAREKLIVGLDVPTVQQAEDIVSKIGDEVLFYKIGYQLVFAGGLEFARDLALAPKFGILRRHLRHEARAP